jgi:hypothetical protein
LGSWTSSIGQSATTKNKKDYPQIVAQVHLTGQTAPIPPTTLLVPKKDGLYRVSAYLVDTRIGKPLTVLCFSMTWTDDAGAETSGPIPFDGQYGSQFTPWSTTMRVNAGTPLSYSATDNDCHVGPVYTYEVFFTVERLE